MIVAGSTSPLLLSSSGYNLQRSLRFRSSASAYLNRTPASAGNRQTWTFSCWVKRGSLGSQQFLISTSDLSSTSLDVRFESSDSLSIGGAGAGRITTTAVFRDPSAWYHVVAIFNTTNATEANRMQLYVNNVLQTVTGTYPTLNYQGYLNQAVIHEIGRARGGGSSFDGYLTEINFIDGQALTPSSFGQNNAQTGVWQPKKYTGTYGTNGFYLPFTNNSTTTTLGNDFSGNGNNWTTNNISLTSGSTYDSMTDVPTLTSATAANFATLNPLQLATSTTISGGNLNYAYNSGTDPRVPATIGVTSGKWYFEQTLTSATVNNLIGWWSDSTGFNSLPSVYVHYYSRTSSPAQAIENSSGTVTGTTSNASNGDVIGVALDYSTGTVYFYRNNILMNTVSGMTLNGATLFPLVSYTSSASGSATSSLNFGQRPFAYTPPTGFVALNTFNLPTPTIGATASTQANRYFDPVLWTGNGSNTRTITGLNFQPDFVWAKVRSTTGQHTLQDAVRGASNELSSNTTGAEVSSGSNGYGYVTSFTSDGFATTAGSVDNSLFNANSATYVAWNWNAGGSTVTNTSGSISSQVRANTSAGFSIVTYAGAQGSNFTIGHGLNVAPSMVITKSRNATGSWGVYYRNNGVNTNWMSLNSTAAQGANDGTLAGGSYMVMNSSTLQIASSAFANGASQMVAYCFAEVAGYSRFGSYTGNGSSDGPFVFTGFRPKYILWKNASTTSGWGIRDTTRNPSNVANLELAANTSDAEVAGQGIDILSNGFKLRTADAWYNGNGNTMIFMAFAEFPFRYSLAR